MLHYINESIIDEMKFCEEVEKSNDFYFSCIDYYLI